MATTIIAPAFSRDARGHLVAKSGNIIFDFGDLSTLFAGLGGTSTPTSASGPTQRIISIINNVVKFNDGTPDQQIVVQDAMQVMIAKGKLPANATIDDFQAAITGKAGKDSTVAGPPGPSNYARALALGTIPAGMTEAQYVALPKPGLLVSGTALTKGNLVYFNAAAGQQTDAKLVSHEQLQGSVGMVDKDGDIIAPGNAVDVTGLGFTTGSSYYLEARDANGRNLQPLPDPFPAALMPSKTRVYANVGTVIASGSKQILNFVPVVSVGQGASAANFSATDFTFLPYAIRPTAAQIRRLVDTQGNYGESLNGLHAEGDAGIPDNGFPTPPPRKLVSGTWKNVMLFDIGYNGFHANTLAQWGPQQSGDWLNVFEVADGNQAAPGFIFGANAAGTSMWGVRLYGACTLMAFQQITISGDTVSTSDFRGTVNVTGANKVLMCMRLNISADGKTVTAKVWPYDTTKSLAQQGLSEPAASPSNSGSYTASTAFPVGYVMPVFGNGTFRRVYSAKSNDPSLPAQFDGDL